VAGSRWTLVVAPASGGPRVSSEGVKYCLEVPVLVIVTARVLDVFGSATEIALVGLSSRPLGLAVSVRRARSWIDNATFTAAKASMRPAPCSDAGAEMSCAVLMMICFTKAGVGLLPLWVLRYAWMIKAASPAVSGEDSLVPPVFWSMGVGPPL
jgi:hypothetical protein